MALPRVPHIASLELMSDTLHEFIQVQKKQDFHHTNLFTQKMILFPANTVVFHARAPIKILEVTRD